MCPYLLHYRAAFAFSILLYPQPYRLSLRSSFPCGRATDLPRFAHVPRDDVGLACSPVALHLRWGKAEIPQPVHIPFGPSLTAPLACYRFTTFISDSPELTISSDPRSRPPWC